jgi:hypothetical protein
MFGKVEAEGQVGDLFLQVVEEVNEIAPLSPQVYLR